MANVSPSFFKEDFEDLPCKEGKSRIPPLDRLLKLLNLQLHKLYQQEQGISQPTSEWFG